MGDAPLRWITACVSTAALGERVSQLLKASLERAIELFAAIEQPFARRKDPSLSWTDEPPLYPRESALPIV
jgi:hypothetical protein